MNNAERCVGCGRTPNGFKGRTVGGRLCSSCTAERNSGQCEVCGQHRCFDGLDPNGRRWCNRCRAHHDRPVRDAPLRSRIVDVVALVDPGLAREVIDATLTSVTPHAKSLLRISRHIDNHPDVFTTGPTSTNLSIDRFVRALIKSGSTTIRHIYPSCIQCHRQRRQSGRRGTGWICLWCVGRGRHIECVACKATSGAYIRDFDGLARCGKCVRSHDRDNRLAELNETIIAIVASADPTISRDVIASAIEAAARPISKRAALLVELREAPSMRNTAQRGPIVALFVDRLRCNGSTLPAATCETCNGAAEPLIVAYGIVRCRACARICPFCHQATKDLYDKLCRRCDTPKGRVRGACTGCDLDRVLLDDNQLCRRCREALIHVCVTCNGPGPLTGGHCHRCLLATELDTIMGDSAAPWAESLRAGMLAASNPTTTRHWLHDKAGGNLLALILQDPSLLSHETLDGHHGRGINHLRGRLVSAGALAPDERWIDRLERDLTVTVNDITDQADRKVVAGWVRWHALPRMRRRAETGQSTVHSETNLRAQTRQIVLFVGQLHARQRQLATCTQADIDSWFAQLDTNTSAARVFLNWAAKRRHVPSSLELPRHQEATPTPGDSGLRWQLARRLVNDTTITAADRVLGALAVLYAQPVTRIAALTTTDIHCDADGTVTVTLARRVAIELVEPFGSLARQLPERRRDGLSDQLPTIWLFPGTTPDRHTTSGALSVRLRRLGIEPRAMRSAALGQLAAEIPPAILASTVGITASTAARWATIVGGDWTRYAASTSKQTGPDSRR